MKCPECRNEMAPEQIDASRPACPHCDCELEVRLEIGRLPAALRFVKRGATSPPASLQCMMPE